MDHTKPWLRYIDADAVDDATLDVDGMAVRNSSGEELGKVDGFIVDSQSGRTYYFVVDGGGWFSARQFLLPIGQVRLSAGRDALITDLSKARVDRYPGFDKDEFDRLTDEDIKRINDDICTIFGEPFPRAAGEPHGAAWNRRSFQQPDWWPETGMASGSPRRERSYQEERSVANDTSPHFDGRAQPGDVLGVETGGERTGIGDTREDENRRRDDAEKAVRKERS